MKFNHENKTIEITKAEAIKAQNIDSEMYNIFMKHKNAMPDYEVVIIKRKPSKSKNKDKGLTYSLIEKYILAHDDAEKNMAEYKKIRLDAELSTGYSISAYKTVREWFLTTYPEVKKYRENKIA